MSNKAAGEYQQFPEVRPKSGIDYLVDTADGDKFVAYFSNSNWYSRETDLQIPYCVISFAEINDYDY